MSQPQIELSYDQAKVPWHRRRRVQRYLTLAAILIAAVWAINASRPIWPRYRYYRLQQQAATYMIGPSKVMVRHSATRPYLHVPAPADQFSMDFWNASNQSQLGLMTIGMKNDDLIYCGLRTTPAGIHEIVQIYSGAARTGQQTSLWFLVVACDCQGWGWVLAGSPSRAPALGGIHFGEISIGVDPTANVAACCGTGNSSDPSETDVAVILNGQSTTLKFHIAEVPMAKGQIGIAANRNYEALMGNPNGGSSSSVWDWPFTGK